METQAVLRGVRISAQKGRLVADQVRGKPVEAALNILTFSPKKAAKIVKKVLESAIANAEHNDGADVDELKVSRIHVDEGQSLRRFSARAKGRGVRIEKQTCHIYLTVGTGKKRKAEEGERWDRRYTRPDSGLPSAATGLRAGTPATRTSPTMLNDDIEVREFLRKRLKNASVGRVLIERPAKNARITIFSARPGVVIGKKGEDIEKLKVELHKMLERAGARQHRGDPQARDRRATGRRLDHAAAREADHVPPRDEAGDPERDAARRARHQDHERGPPERRRDRPYRVVPRRSRAAAHAARRRRLRHLRGADHLRHHRRQGLGLQGRHAGPQRRAAGRREGAAPPAERDDRRPRRSGPAAVPGGGAGPGAGRRGRGGRRPETAEAAPAAAACRRGAQVAASACGRRSFRRAVLRKRGAAASRRCRRR